MGNMKNKKISPALDYLVDMPGNDYLTYEELIAAHETTWRANARIMPGDTEPYKPTLVGRFEDGTPEWLAARERMCVSPSSAGALFGLSEYSTAQDVFYEKNPSIDQRVNKPAPPDPARMKAGHRGEAYVAAMLVEELEKAGHTVGCYYDDALYESSVVPKIGGNIDRILVVDGVPCVGEIKTVGSNSSAWKDYWQAGIVPPQYEVQVRLYLHILNLPFAYIIGNSGWGNFSTVVLRVDRDYAVEDEILRKCSDFIGYCEMGTCPPATFSLTGSKALQTYLSNRYGVLPSGGTAAKSTPIPESPEATEIFESILAYKEKRAALEKELQTLDQEMDNDIARLMELSGGAATLSYPVESGTAYVQIKQHTSRASLDEERIKADHPDFYEASCEKKFSGTRFKSLYGGFVSAYEVPGRPTVGQDKKSLYLGKIWVN